MFVINRGDDSIHERKLVFYPPLVRREEFPLLVYDTSTSKLSLLTNNQIIGMERQRMISDYFWDPHTRENYQFCESSRKPYEEGKIAGWYYLTLNDYGLIYRLHSKDRYWAHYSPPEVQLTGTKLFSTRYEYLGGYVPFSRSHRTSSLIIDLTTKENIWKSTVATSNFTDYYWITENWYINVTPSRFLTGNVDRRINTISNYETGGTVSFLPEQIIGYGAGVILTTRETETGLTGITVWTPEKEILYRDNNFSVSGVIDRDQGEIKYGRPGIYISYFDFPYIYCNIGRVQSITVPYATLILDLINSKTYITPEMYHLLGIFD